MTVLILNSGMGSRMGDLTSSHPKCMTDIGGGHTIVSRQLCLLSELGIGKVVMTTGYFDDVLENSCREVVSSKKLGIEVRFVNNPDYASTNYIYSMYCARDFLDDDIVLMHGDLVFEKSVLADMLEENGSCMKVSSTIALPEKDFKAVVENGFVKAVGVEFFDRAMEAQALYKLNRRDWKVWLDRICAFCESGKKNCYAEAALNEVTSLCRIRAFDVRDRLCTEIDNPVDLEKVKNALGKISDVK